LSGILGANCDVAGRGRSLATRSNRQQFHVVDFGFDIIDVLPEIAPNILSVP